jgi:hypothetical protein
MFEGPVRLWQHESREWREMPLANEFVEDWRGLGVADMAYAVRDGRPHRANGSLVYHVLISCMPRTMHRGRTPCRISQWV